MWALYAIHMITDNGDWYTIEVTHMGGDTGDIFDTSDEVVVCFARTGDKGDMGNTGSTGPGGPTGSTDNGGGGEPGAGAQVIGDPMVYPVSGNPEGDYAMVLYRNGNFQAYKARNIQMLNVINYWWMASVLDGTDNQQTMGDPQVQSFQQDFHPEKARLLSFRNFQIAL